MPPRGGRAAVAVVEEEAEALAAVEMRLPAARHSWSTANATSLEKGCSGDRSTDIAALYAGDGGRR